MTVDERREALYTRAEYRREELNRARELQGLPALRLGDVLRQWYARELDRLTEEGGRS